jgi:Flp pilus assembly protein TadD
LLVLVLALAVRIIYIHQLQDNPFFNYPLVDSMEYHKMALKIAQGEAPREDAFYQPPLYTYFLAFLYRLFGVQFFTVRLLQVLLGVVNVWLVFLLAKRIFGFKIALGSAIVFSLYGTMLFFEGELLAPVLIVGFNLLLMLSMLRFLEKPSWPWALVCGLILGLSAITMAVVLPFAAVALAAWFFFLKRGKDKETMPLKKKLALGLCFIAGISVIVLPVTVSNWKRGKEFVLISSNAGINFYLGTGRDFEKKVAVRPGLEWKALMREPLEAGYEKQGEQSSYFLKKSLQDIIKDPAGFFIGTFKKLYHFLHGHERMRNQEIYPFRSYSSLLSVLLWKKVIAFPFGILFPLAVVGAVFSLVRKKKENYLLLLFSVSHIAVIILFFIAARYRMNILPFLVIQAVYGVTVLYGLLRDRAFVTLANAGALLLALLVLCNWKVGPMPDRFNADAYFNLGAYYKDEGRSQVAKEMFEKAVAQDPQYPDANGNLGIARASEGDLQGAVECFNVLLARFPDDIEANTHLGVAYGRMGELEKAKQQFLKVLRLDKVNEEAKHNLQIVNRRLQEKIEQRMGLLIERLEGELRSKPNHPEILSNLGMLHIMKKEYGRAEELLRKATAAAPGFPQAHNNLGIVLMELKKFAEARQAFETALKLAPGYESPKKNLERLKRMQQK